MDPMDEDTPGSSKHQTTAETTPSTAKHPAPSPTQGGTPASSGHNSASSQQQQASKRRRGLGVVTPNACTECRKKRAKCDGQRPCGRCRAQKDAECVYEVPVRQSKENLRSEIDQLRRKQHKTDNILAALARPDQWEEVLHRLRSGQSIETISEWLGGTLPSGGGATMPSLGQRPNAVPNHLAPLSTFSGPATTGYAPAASTRITTQSSLPAHPHAMRQEIPDPNSPWSTQFSIHDQGLSARSDSHADAMSWTTEGRMPPQSRVGSWVENMKSQDLSPQRLRALEQVITPEMPDMKLPPLSWTHITSDISLVQHLLTLYFCWEYPTFASLSKEHFLKDYQDGRPRYCSPILVNALLALGCRFSSQPATRMNPNDPYTSGDHFFKECQRLYYMQDSHHTLTTIQALGIMSIREASCGRDSESWYYAGQSIRLAFEMGLHRISDEDGADEDHIAVQSATFWGAFALDHAWSLATGSLPQCSSFPHLPPKPAIIDDVEASLWIPYTDDGAPLQRSCEQPSNVRSVYKCFCELSELVHQSLYILHSPGRPLTSRDLLKIYTQYLNWYDRIPEVLRLGHNFTPAVLFAHMYYHFAILLLFRPLIKLRIVGSGILPKDVCAQAADAIQGLVRSYSQLYTLRRTPSFVPYFVLTSSIMHLAIAASFSDDTILTGNVTGSDSKTQELKPRVEPRVAESIRRGIEDLTEMAPCHQFAEQALNILRYLAKKWKLEEEIRAQEKDENEKEERKGHHGGKSNGVGLEPDESNLRPLTDSLNFFAPNVMDSDFNCQWGQTIAPMSQPPPPLPKVENGSGGGEQGGGGRGSSIAAKTASKAENPLFWPFPLQGRPMLPSGESLREAGFEVI